MYEIGLEHIELSEERIGEDKICKDSKSFDFANNYGEDDDGVSHSLNIANVGTVEVKHLQYLSDFELESFFVL